VAGRQGERGYRVSSHDLKVAKMEHITGLQQFLLIATQADNIPIAGMLILVLFFTYMSFKQARRNDQLIERGKRDQIIEEMRR
jgi:hypothetical protein